MRCNSRHAHQLVTTSHLYQSAFCFVKASFCDLTFYDRQLLWLEFTNKILDIYSQMYYLLAFAAACISCIIAQAMMGGARKSDLGCYTIFVGRFHDAVMFPVLLVSLLRLQNQLQ